MNILEPHISLNVSSIYPSVAFYEKAFQDHGDQAPTRLFQVRSIS